jgi:hypothetical protein
MQYERRIALWRKICGALSPTGRSSYGSTYGRLPIPGSDRKNNVGTNNAPRPHQIENTERTLISTTTVTVVRVLHITCTVFWVIASTILTLFVMPVLAKDRSGAAWGERILQTWRLDIILGISAPVGIITGIWLIAALHGFRGGGLGELLLRIGALAAMVAFATGILFIAPLGSRIRRTTQRLDLATDAKDTAVIAEISRLDAWYRLAHNLMIVSQWIALLGMSVFRYL